MARLGLVGVFRHTLGGLIPTIEAALGRSATRVVAASNASLWSKLGADYICSGAKDNVALQAAINDLSTTYGGRVYLTEGIYYIEVALTLGRSAVRIEGASRGNQTPNRGTTLLAMAAISLFSETAAYVDNGLANMTLDGNRGTYASVSGILWAGFANVTLDNVDVVSFGGNGIDLRDGGGYQGSQHYLRNVVCKDNGGDGLYAANEVLSAEDCRFEINLGNGVSIRDAMCRIEKSQFEGNTGWALQVYTTNRTWVTDNNFRLPAVGASGSVDVFAPDADPGDIWIVNNHIDNLKSGVKTGTGVRVYSSDANTARNVWIEANDIANCATGVLEAKESGGATDPDEVTIKDNHIHDNTTQVTLLAGAHHIRDNFGWRTENGGVASVADGGTIAHGLVAAPTRYTLTPTVADRTLAVTAVGATTMTVALKVGSTGAAVGVAEDVAWEARVYV